MIAKALFWGSAAALAWTHVGYPAAAALAARLRPRPVRKGGGLPSVAVVVAAHDEEKVIERRLENLLGLDYPAELVEVVVASDGSQDRTDELVESIAEREPRVRLVRSPRGGKVAAQHRAVGETTSEILAFSDANATWAAPALRKLVRNFADPDVAYVCGQLRLERPDGTNQEGAYWRYELWLRERESELGSVTAGNGSIYAIRRADYVYVDPRFGHDLLFPYRMVQRGRRAVYEPEAVSFEPAASDVEDEWGRKVRMLTGSWLHVFSGRMLRRVDPLYAVQLVSHRHLRYASGVLHVVLLGASAALARLGFPYRHVLAAQLLALTLAAAGALRIALPGAALAEYYVVVSAATLAGLVAYLRRGVQLVWDPAVGTR